ncbi:PRD domain-containing protein [Exiguobacterium aurantiacum]|uniref:PRD domain-containing protein n=1 Tax=Exiguobacterium aurantiacum TaxID=33987 RepID=UPI001E46BE90|nr:PRD domain-containing protein [Exiguobacterium aurantiacum]
MIKIKKVLNSSVVLVEDEDHKDFILFGKGIGYARKVGDTVERKSADQIYMSVDNPKAKELVHLIDSIPNIYLSLTQDIVAHAEKRLGTKLNSGIYFTLMDHLHFAVERHQKNINITNRVYWEIKNYYAVEFEVGTYAVDLLNRALQVDFPKEEAANIAFHLINAQSEETGSRAGMNYAKMIGAVVNMVRYSLNIPMDKESIHYTRFITHVKFFVERFYEDKLLVEKDNMLFNQIATLYPNAMEVAFKVKSYIEQVYGKEIPNDELTYLAVHIHRLMSQDELNDA